MRVRRQVYSFLYSPDPLLPLAITEPHRAAHPSFIGSSNCVTLGSSCGVLIHRAAVGSSYGAAGSIIALVVWVYYATQILFVGAEFTQVQARHRGAAIQPTPNAERTDDSAGVKDDHRNDQPKSSRIPTTT